MGISELDRAIAAHGMWKAHLRSAIDTGKLDKTEADIRSDNKCVFGQWLYGPDVDKTSPFYAEAKKLHADFHKEAADVVHKALAGDKAGAEVLLAGPFTKASTRLTAKLMAWKKTMKA